MKLEYLLTYNLSQDNIEIMFGTIRRRLGWNNNHTALEFQRAFRGVLSHVGVVLSRSANILTGASDDILDMRDTSDNNLAIEKPNLFDSRRSKVYLIEKNYNPMPALSLYIQNVSCYIAGFVVRNLLPCLKCETCRKLVIIYDVDPADYKGYIFLKLKNNGGLVIPSPDVVVIVQITEQVVRRLIPINKPVHELSHLGQELEFLAIQKVTACQEPTLTRLGHQLEQTVLQELNMKQLVATTDHALETVNGIDNHIFSLIRQVIRFYLIIRKHHLVKTWNLQQRGISIRHTKNKEILFKHQ